MCLCRANYSALPCDTKHVHHTKNPIVQYDSTPFPTARIYIIFEASTPEQMNPLQRAYYHITTVHDTLREYGSPIGSKTTNTRTS